jgi:hypothetical protein
MHALGFCAIAITHHHRGSKSTDHPEYLSEASWLFDGVFIHYEGLSSSAVNFNCWDIQYVSITSQCWDGRYQTISNSYTHL